MKNCKKQKVLVFHANALPGQTLGIERELRAMQSELDRSALRDQFELHNCWAVEPPDVLDALRRHEPAIVHFSGHAIHPMASARPDGVVRRDVEPPARSNRPDGLCFPRADGSVAVLSRTALRDTFRAVRHPVGHPVGLVVLNACHTEPHARALRTEIDCVIGTHGAIQDDAAIHFATGLYGGIFGGFSIERAFRQGLAALELWGLTDRFSLLARPGIDPRTILPANRRPCADRPPRPPRRPPRSKK